MYVRVLFLCFLVKLIRGDGDTNTNTSNDIAKILVDRYNDLSMMCYDEKNNTKPAFQCSGLIIRGLANIGGREQKYAWSKKETNVRKNAFSAAFLRKDQQFNGFAHGYDSGFIYYPHLNTPKNKNRYRVYCAFPIDAHTDFRGGDNGCGEYYKDPSGRSGDCETQHPRINTLKRWTQHFTNVQKGQPADFRFGRFQCGFNMMRSNAAKNFALIIEIKKYLRRNSRKYSWYHNELLLRAWNEVSNKFLYIFL